MRILVCMLGILLFVSIRASLRHNSISAQTSSNQTSRTGAVRSGLFKYLPDGAQISNPNKDIVFADLDDDGRPEEIIFYGLPRDHKIGILVLKTVAGNYTKLWEVTYDDAWGFYDLSGVYDLNKSGRPQIIAYRGIGASCPGVLEIYESRKGKIERITGEWADNGHCNGVELKDLNGNGSLEIIIKTRNRGVNPDIYRWNGKQYAKSNSQFSPYYDDDLRELILDIYSSDPMPPSWRVTWGQQAVGIYLLQHRYGEAVALSNDLLRITDDPKLTNPNPSNKGTFTPEQMRRIADTFEIEKIEGKSRIHLLLGDTYKAAGNPQQAQEQYKEAKNLEDVAKDLRFKLPPVNAVPRQ